MLLLKNKIWVILFFFSLFSWSSHSHYLDDNTLFIVGSTSVAQLIEVTEEPFYQQDNIKVIVRPIGSDKGIISVAEGVSNIAVISRFLTSDEMKKWPHLQQITIAQDAIVLMVNPNNPIDEITTDELVNLYTGKRKYWLEQDKHSKVLLMSKSIGHGTHSSFIEYLGIESMPVGKKGIMVFKKRGINSLYSKQKVKPYRKINQAVANVFRNKNAIAYESLGAYRNFLTKRPSAKLKLLKLDQQSPLIDNKINNKYAFKRPFNILINDDKPELAQSYIDFLLSDKGQKILAEHYYIPLAE